MRHDPWKFAREAALQHKCGIKFLTFADAYGFHIKAWLPRAKKPFFVYRFSSDKKRQMWIEGCINRMEEANISNGLNEAGLFYLGRTRKPASHKKFIDLIGRVVVECQP